MRSAFNRILATTLTVVTSWVAQAQFTFSHVGGGATGFIVTNMQNGSYTFEGGGNDIWSAADEFDYAHFDATGDFDVRVRVESLELTATWTKAGLMARENLNGNSRMAFNRVTPGAGANDSRYAYRTGTTSGPQGEHEDGLGAPEYPNAWLRLRRGGNIIEAYRSTDGLNWSSQGVQDTATWEGGALPGTVLLGLAVSRHSGTETLATAEFREFGSPSNAVALAEQPASQTRFVDQTATFSIRVPGGYDFVNIQWYKNSSPIAGANSRTYTTPALVEADSGAVYSAIVSNTANGTTVTSSSATLTVLANPQMTDASSRFNPVGTNIYVAFSKDMGPSALNPANYSIVSAGAPTPLLAAGNPVIGVGATAGSSASTVSAVGTTAGANNYPAGEAPAMAIDNNAASKFLNFAEVNVGLIVTRAAGAAVAQGFRFTTANDAPERDPVTVTIEGTTAADPNAAATSATWTLLYSGPSGLATNPGRNANGTQISIANTTAFNTYRILITGIRDAVAANSVQFGEVQLFNTAGGGAVIAANSAVFHNSNPRLVRLGLSSALTVGTTYNVTGTGISDTSSLLLNPNPTTRSFTHMGGINARAGLSMRRYDGSGDFNTILGKIAGCAVPQRESTTMPDFEYTTSEAGDFNGGNLFGDANTENYGTWVYGLFRPPVTGNYQFGFSSDDHGELFLSTDSSPANKVLISTMPAWNAYRRYVTQADPGSSVPQLSPVIPLVAGRLYYMEAIVQEGGGGDHVAVTVRKPGDPAIVDFQPSMSRDLFATNYSVGCPPSLFFDNVGPVVITDNPVGQTVNELANATFRVRADGSPASTAGYNVQWYSNGVPVMGATSLTYTFQTLRYANGAQYYAVVQNGFSSATSTVANLTVISDEVPPQLVRAFGSGTFTNVTVVFNEPVNVASGTTAANYVITNSAGVPLAVLSASIRDNTNVVLRTAAQTPNERYTVVVNNVGDRAGISNPIAANSTVSFTAWVFTPGYALMEVYKTFGGNTIQILTNFPNYPNYPSERYYITTPNSRAAYPTDANEAYGGRISGLFIPASSGNYTFRISRDDDARLNGSLTDNPANAQTIINVACCDDTFAAASPALPLTAGNRYYYELLWKEGTGGDYAKLSIDGVTTIPSALLGVYANPDEANLQIVAPPQNTTKLEGQAAAFSIGATASPGFTLTYQWFSNGVAIAGANASSYTSPNLTLDNDGDIYTVVTIVPGALRTNSATVSVLADTEPPVIARAYTDSSFLQVTLEFSEPINPGPASESSNFYIVDGPDFPEIESVTQTNGSNIIVTFRGHTPLRPGASYTIQADSMFDLYFNFAPEGYHQATFQSFIYNQGFVRFDAYLGLTVPNNNDVSPILNSPKYPNRPDISFYTNQVFWPQTVPNIENYGMRFSGLFRAPEDGVYKFEPAHDDAVIVRFSTDASPTNAVQALSANCCSGFAYPEAGFNATLTANNLYYFEVLVIEAGGGDIAGLAVTLPNGQYLAPIPSRYLVSVVDPAVGAANPVTITTHPASQSVLENASATFAVAINNPGPAGAGYQWQVNEGAGFVDIAGAISSSYTTPPLALASSGIQYRVSVHVPGKVLYSDAATVTVTPDNVAPTAISARATGSNTFEIVFSELLNGGSAGELSNYQVTAPSAGTLAIASTVLDASGRRVNVTTVNGLPCEYITVTLNGISDLAGNPIAENSTVSFNVFAPFGLVHRYDFNNPAAPVNDAGLNPGANAMVADLVGGAHGFVRGVGGNFTGTRVTLPGGSSAFASYVDLPNGLLSSASTNNGGTGKITLEGWVKVTGIQNWSRIVDFGSSTIGENTGPGGGGDGQDYLFYSAAEGGNQNRHVVTVREVNALPDGSTLNNEVGFGFDTTFNADIHFVITWDEATGQLRAYENGVLKGSLYTIVPFSKIHDVNVWLGRSNWSGDANMQGEFDEFRIYNRILSAEDRAFNAAVGPDFNLGTPTAVRLEIGSTHMFEGRTQQATVYADFATVSNVNLTAMRCFSIVSSAPSVVSANNTGILQAGTSGTATLHAAFAGVSSPSVNITVTPDNVGPELVSATADASFTTVTLTFDEPLNPVPASEPTFFQLSGPNAATVVSATPNGATVVLTVSPALEPGGLYGLDIFFQEDTLGNGTDPDPLSTTFRAFVYNNGFVRFDAYLDLNVPDYNNPAPILSAVANGVPPSFGFYTNNVNWPQTSPDLNFYGMRLHGYFRAPETGVYKFEPAHDDSGVLFFGTSPSTKSNLFAFACCTGFGPADPGALVELQANQIYYFDLQVVEAGGGDYAGLAVTLPSGAYHAPIPGQFLVNTFDPTGASIVITQQPANDSVVLGTDTNATFSVVATAVNSSGSNPQRFYQWYRNNGSGWSAISGANSDSYTLPFPCIADNGAQFRVEINIAGATRTSSAATLNVSGAASLAVNSTTICAGATGMLTATTDAQNPTYLWSPGGQTTASINVSPGSTTEYTVTVTDGVSKCQYTASGTVTVNPLPTVAINVNSEECPGSTAVLTATTDAANPTYLWMPGGETTASITNTPTATTTYTVTVTDGVTGCSKNESVIIAGPNNFVASSAVTINDNGTASSYPATINVSGLTSLVCKVTVTLSNLSHNWPDDMDILLVGPSGQSVRLMSDAGGGNALSGAVLKFADAASSALPDESAINSGTYLPSEHDTKVDVFPAPAPASPYGNALSVFNGTNPNGAWSLYIVDDESGDSGTLGGWSLAISVLEPFTDVAIASEVAPEPVAVGSNLTYTITVSNNGPSAAGDVTVTDTLPGGVAFGSAVSSQGSCAVDAGVVTCTLGSVAPSSSATITLVLTPTSAGSVNHSVSVSTSTTELNLANNSAANSSTVLNPVVIDTAPIAQVVCAGTDVTFSVAASGDSLSYQWFSNGVAIASATSSTLSLPNAQPNFSATYSVTVNNAASSASAGAALTVNALPTVAVSGGTTICPGQPSILTAVSDAANATYLWSPGGETTASITNSPTSTTVYTVTVTDGVTGCSKEASATVTILPPNEFADASSITINDNSGGTPFPATINVSGMTSLVCKVTVTLNNLSHAWPDDIDLLLVGPGGQKVLLMSDAGGGDALSGVNLTFDDAAASQLPDAAAISSGTYRPSNFDNKVDSFPPAGPYSSSLGVFNDTNPNGQWSLYVVDDGAGDAGAIAGGWSLSITALEPFADVAIAGVSSSSANVAVGSNLTYTVTVTNHGPANAAAVTVVDTLPAGASYASSTSTHGTCAVDAGVVTCSLGVLNAGEVATVTISVTPTAAGALNNSVTVSSTTTDLVLVNNSAAAAQVTVLNPAVIQTAPANQVACVNADVIFSVTATGDSLTYQWFSNDVAIASATGATLALNDVQPETAATYSVVVANAASSAGASATLTVTPLHSVVVNGAATICAGSSAMLSVVTDANNPSYLWSPGGATTASINVSPASTTVYTVTVVDGLTGCTNSGTATVTVNPVTSITAIGNKTNCPGTSVTFTTTASGTGPFTYLWRRGASVLQGPDGNNSFTIASVTAGDAGTYTVEVTGTCGSATNSGNLVLPTAPIITMQPTNQIAPVGNGAVFFVSASSLTSLSYQWRTNGVNVPGATGTSFMMTNLTMANDGTVVSVNVQNCIDSVLSANATLTVFPVHGISFDFNTPGQYENIPYRLEHNDWISRATFPNPFIEHPTIGVEGGGAVQVTGTADITTIMKAAPVDFSLHGKVAIASTMVKIKAQTQNNRHTQIGFVTGTNLFDSATGGTPLGINDNTPQGFMSVILQSTAQPNHTYQLRLQHRRTDGGIAEVTPTPTPQGSLIQGNWYRLVGVFENIKGTAANTMRVSAFIQDMGANGATPGAVVISYAPTNIVNTSLVHQKQMYLALRTARSDTGLDAIDNIASYTRTNAVSFVMQPASRTVPQGRTAEFRAMVDGLGPYTYQWNLNGSPIPGARNWKYITGPTLLSDSGAQFTVTVTDLTGNVITSDPATLTVTVDPLSIVSVGSADGNVVGVRFNQPVQKASAEVAANYTVNGVPAAKAVLRPDGKSVLLNVVSHIPGAFTVEAANVQDLNGNTFGSGNTANGVSANLTATDIHRPTDYTAPPGSTYSFGPGEFEVTGGGADIWGNFDAMHYAYTTQTGDFDIKARIPYVDIVRGPTKAGFNARVSLEPTSPMVTAAVNPHWPGRQYYEGSRRDDYNIAAVSWGTTTRVQYPNAWLRFRRVGNTFFRFSSTNGVNWLLDGQTSLAMPDTIYVGLAVSSVANQNKATAQFDNFGGFAGYPGASIAITTQPAASPSVNAGSSVNLTVVAAATGAPQNELAYVWQRKDSLGNWVNLPTAGATNNTLNTGALYGADNGAQYRAIVRLPGATEVISSVSTITVTDAAKPTIASVSAPNLSTHQILVNFSEPVGNSGINPANYVVTNAAGTTFTVVGAYFLGSDQRTVVLTTAQLLVYDNYGVRITGVQDLNGNTVDTVTRTFSPIATAPAQRVVVEHYFNVTGGDLAALNNIVALPRFTGRTPDGITYTDTFHVNGGGTAFANVFGDNFGGRLISYFVPPSNGLYRFWIKSDDAGRLYMNTNAVNSTDPAGKVVLVERNGANANYDTAAVAQNVPLIGGQQYYIEAIFKEGGGNEGFALAVRAQSDGATPAATETAPASMFRFPAGYALPTPVVNELYFNDPGPYGNWALTGAAASDLSNAVNSAAFQIGVPNVVYYNNYMGFNMGAQNNSRADNYVGRGYSYFVAPSNGNYRFYIRSDDASQLYMNTNASNSTDPSGKVLIARSDNCCQAYNLGAGGSVSPVLSLTAGQRYYIETIWKEGGGGDWYQVAVRSSTAGVPPNTEVLMAQHLEFPSTLDRAGAPTISGLTPLNPTVEDGQTITFVPQRIFGAQPVSLYWFKNGQLVYQNTGYGNIPQFTTQPFSSSDNGAVITLVASNALGRHEVSTTVNVTAGTGPEIVSVIGSQYGTSISITFDEVLSTITAENLANYSIPGLTVLSASIDDTGRRVRLETSTHNPGTTYTVGVNGVADRAGNAANTSGNFTAWGVGGRAILVELFTNIQASAVSNLTFSQKYIDNHPDVSGFVNRFGYDSRVGQTATASLNGFGPFPGNGLEFYGARISANFIAPSNGNYRFYISSDDMSELWMNTNSVNSTDPAGKTLIAQMNLACCQGYGSTTAGLNNSALLVGNISLVAGQQYYMEALFKEGGGGDYFRMAFREATDTSVPPDTEIASAQFFTTAANPDVNQLNITPAPPAELTVYENELVELTAGAVTTPASLSTFLTYQWQRTNDGTGTFTNIAGATANSLSFYASLADDGAVYRLQVSIPGTTKTVETLLHVLVDNVPPALVSVSAMEDGRTLGVSFSEPVLPGIATEPTSYYAIDEFNTVLNFASAVFRPGYPNKVLLRADQNQTPLVGNFTLYVDYMVDLASTPNEGFALTATGAVQRLTPQIVGTIGTIAAGGYNLVDGLGFGTPETPVFTDTNGGFDISANGWDIWNTVDGFFFHYREVSGNFDVKVRVNKLVGADQWSKAGLMVRPSTNSNSRTVFVGTTPPSTPIAGQAVNGFFTSLYRDADAGSPVSINNTTPPWIIAYPNAWVRLQRSNSVFYTFWSTNGTDWTLHLQRDTAAAPGGAYPDSVLVGLATASHDQTRSLANNAYVEYRELYFPQPAVITQQPEPSVITVGIHQSVTFSNALATGDNVQYQWRRNGVAVPGATGTSLTIADTAVSDAGTYTLLASTDGGGEVSAGVVLIVTNSLPVAGTDSLSVTQGTGTVTFPVGDLLANDQDPEGDGLSVLWVSGVAPVTYSADFNDGLAPAGATIHANGGLGASVKPTGGVSDSGYLEINPNVASAGGSMVINELTPGKRVSAFTANFHLKIFPASAEPADGFTLSFGSDLADGPTTPYAAENGGTATGFAFCVDNYRFAPIAIGAAANLPGGGNANTAGLKINYKNVIIAGVQIPAAWNTDRWVPVSISVTESGACTVMVDGTNVFGTVMLPNYTPTVGRFGLYGRTGGATMATAVDNLSINVRTIDTALASGFTGGTLYGTAYQGGGFLHLTDALNGQLGSLVLNEITPGAAVTAFNASFGVRIGNGTGNAADGMSFNFANDLPLAAGGVTVAEEGMGTGLSIGIDNYPTGGADSPSFKIKYGGVLVTPPILIPKWGNVNFIPVNVVLTANGELTLTVDGTNVVQNLPTGYVPTVGRFGFYARTGGENETHWIDDLVINVSTAGSPGSYANNFSEQFGPGSVVLTNGVIAYTPPPSLACGTDSFYYLTSDGQLNGTTMGQVTVTLVETNPLPPMIVTCATNRTIVTTNAQEALPDLRGEIGATDTCGTVVISQSPAPGTLVNANTTNVITLTATDSSGLFVTCQATVIIQSEVTEVTEPEFIAGSVVYDSNAGTFSASFLTQNGVTYEIQYKDDLNAPTWSVLGTIVGDGTVKVVSDPGPLPASRFYRIVPQ